MPRRHFDDIDNIMTQYADYTINGFFPHAVRTGEIVMPYHDALYVPEVRDSMDYWAVNYYTRFMIDARVADPFGGKRYEHKHIKLIPMDFYLEEFHPEGLIAILERLKDKPIYITENGLSSYDDSFRAAYIALHLSAIKEAMDRGIDVQGYLYWSLLDNYEWGSYIPRFGLVDVNFDNFKRIPKKSAIFYKEIIENRGITQEMIKKYIEVTPVF